MEKWEGKIAVVTGASHGLGNALCKILVRSGMIVIGMARKFDKIQITADELKGEKGKLIPMKVNLFKPEQIEEVFQTIEENYGGISVLVNMASTASIASMIEEDPDWMEAIFVLNTLAPAILCKLATKSMRKHNIDGHIVNIGGTASYYTSVFDDYHLYSVSKFMLRAIGDGLRNEFRADNINIRVSHIGPGHIMTGSQDTGIKDAEKPFIQEEMRKALMMIYGQYGLKEADWPEKLNIDLVGESIYKNKVLPALQMQDVNDYIIAVLASPQGAEVMDIIMKPLDRQHHMFESDYYWSQIKKG